MIGRRPNRPESGQSATHGCRPGRQRPHSLRTSCQPSTCTSIVGRASRDRLPCSPRRRSPSRKAKRPSLLHPGPGSGLYPSGVEGRVAPDSLHLPVGLDSATVALPPLVVIDQDEAGELTVARRAPAKSRYAPNVRTCPLLNLARGLDRRGSEASGHDLGQSDNSDESQLCWGPAVARDHVDAEPGAFHAVGIRVPAVEQPPHRVQRAGPHGRDPPAAASRRSSPRGPDGRGAPPPALAQARPTYEPLGRSPRWAGGSIWGLPPACR